MIAVEPLLILPARETDTVPVSPCLPSGSRVSYSLLAVTAAWVGGAVATGAFDFDPSLFGRALIPIGAGLVGCWLARVKGIGQLIAPIEMTFVFVAAMFLMAFGAITAASTAAPLADTWLRSLDSDLFGFDRDAFVGHFKNSPPTMQAFGWIYMSLGWMPQLLFILLAIIGRAEHAWATLNALLATLVVSVACLALMPAYGSPPYAYQFIDVLDGARNGSIRRFDEHALTGLVTFPSMHAAYGVILARGSALVGWIGLPLVMLNVAVVFSALIVGGHYLIDVVAGCALAAIAIWIAQFRWWGGTARLTVKLTQQWQRPIGKAP
jgi:membrane-associated phospholipid phosphatase